MTDPRVRVRGIYATAITRILLDGGITVVQPSPSIATRFDHAFSSDAATVRIDSTGDQEGVQIVGAAAERVVDRLDATCEGVWSWAATLPQHALFVGRVVETSDHGAIVDVGAGRPGFLPFSRTRGYVDADDRVLVQVKEPYPPWSIGRRPVLTQELLVATEVATVTESVDGQEGENEHLANVLDRLSIDVPGGWGIRWHDPARSLELSAIQHALSDATAVAARLDAARDDADADEPGPVVEPAATYWCWFDREGRDDLDRYRRAVVETMAGHHRVKAGGGPASAAVDFVEALSGSPPDFEADAAIAVHGPAEVTDRADGGEITIEREMTGGGTYDDLGTEREAGDRAVSTFVEGRWWYPTVYRSVDGERKGTYVNVGTPLEVFPDRVRYMDLHVDVIKRPTGAVEVVDGDELDDAVGAGQVPEPIAARARQVAASIASAL